TATISAFCRTSKPRSKKATVFPSCPPSPAAFKTNSRSRHVSLDFAQAAPRPTAVEGAEEGGVGARSDRRHAAAADPENFRGPARRGKNLRQARRLQSRRLGEGPPGLAHGAGRIENRPAPPGQDHS